VLFELVQRIISDNNYLEKTDDYEHDQGERVKNKKHQNNASQKGLDRQGAFPLGVPLQVHEKKDQECGHHVRSYQYKYVPIHNRKLSL
jgi:hypothetical protein